MISIAALRDVLTAFKSKEMPTAAELEKTYAKDIEILKGRQRDGRKFRFMVATARTLRISVFDSSRRPRAGVWQKRKATKCRRKCSIKRSRI